MTVFSGILCRMKAMFALTVLLIPIALMVYWVIGGGAAATVDTTVAPGWARILYSVFIAWIGVICWREIAPMMLNHTYESRLNRTLAGLGIIFLIVFLGICLYCTVTGKITSDTRR
jgi:hypothetical protein